MGFGDDFKEIEQDATGQGGNDGDNNANEAYVFYHLLFSSFHSQNKKLQCWLKASNGESKKGEDTMVDSAVDEFATKEGVPAGFDSEVNNVVNDEVNKL